MIFPLHEPTLHLLTGLQGLELGASGHNPFGVNALNVAPLADRRTILDQIDLGCLPRAVDLDGHAEYIPADDSSQDFVIASWVLHLTPNLLGALHEINRVVRNGGYVVIFWPAEVFHISTVAEIMQVYEERGLGTPVSEAELWINGRLGNYWRLTQLDFSALVQMLKSGLRYNTASQRQLRLDWRLDWSVVAAEDPDTKTGAGWFLAFKVKKNTEDAHDA